MGNNLKLNTDYLISRVAMCLGYELPLPVLNEAVAGGDHGDVVGTDNVQVKSPEVDLISARKLQLS